MGPDINSDDAREKAFVAALFRDGKLLNPGTARSNVNPPNPME